MSQQHVAPEAAALPRSGNHLVDAILARGEDRAPFLVEPGGVTWSYGDLREIVARTARALLEIGVTPGDRVAAQIEKSPQGLALYLGAIAAGAVFLPLNTGYTGVELAHILRDAEPTVVVCDPMNADALSAATSARIMTLDAMGAGTLGERIAHAAADFGPVARDEGDLAAILYTSGTTGRPKGAMITHGNLVSNARALVDIWRFSAADRLLHALPIYHTHGLFTALNTAMAAGASSIFLRKFDAAAVLEAMPKATVMMGVPTFYTRLLDSAAFTREAARGMRLFTSGSAPLLAETHRRFAERCGHAILERYGMTETNMTTSNPYEGERRAGTVGFPLPDVAVRVVNADGGSLPVGQVGSIEVKGPNVFAGYWRDAEKTAKEFRADGYFVTGDLGRVDADGYLHIVGRDKDLIIAGGLNIYPKEIELALDACPGVAESAVIGVPHPDLGEGVTAIVVAKPGASLGEADLLAALADSLARFKQPKRAIIVPDLPRNAMGKVQKNVLRQTYKDLYGVV